MLKTAFAKRRRLTPSVQDRMSPHCPKAKEWFAFHVLKAAPLLPPGMLQEAKQVNGNIGMRAPGMIE